MGTFSSLESGEAILGVSTKNPEAGCPKTTDAAGMAGAAIATAALLAGGAVAAIGLSLASANLTPGKAAADKAISDALSNASASADTASADALAAVNAGPGSEADAKIQTGKTEVVSAQSDAMKLANERRSGVDTKIVDASAKIASASKFITEQIATATYFVTNGPQIIADMGVTMGKAALQKAPTPQAPTPPIPAPQPVPALPLRVPVTAVAVPTVVNKPPEAVSISAPTSVGNTKAFKTTNSTTTITLPTTEGQLEQIALSKEELDSCADLRNVVRQDLREMWSSTWGNILEVTDNSSQWKAQGLYSTDTGSTFMSGRGKLAKPILLLPITTGVYPGASKNASEQLALITVATDDLLKCSKSELAKTLIQVGPLIGSSAWKDLTQKALIVVGYAGTCEEVQKIADITSQKAKYISTFNSFYEALLASMVSPVNEEQETSDAVEKAILLWHLLTSFYIAFPISIRMDIKEIS